MNGEQVTWSNNQRRGAAAGEAVQQRLGLDVGVEEGHRAARLSQAEPDAQEVGLVAHEHGDTVSLLQPDGAVEHVGQPVAAAVDVPVGVDAAVVQHEGLVGDALRLLHEAIQDRAHAGRQSEELQLHAVPDDPAQEEEVPPEVGEAEPLEGGEQQPGAERRGAAQVERHAAAGGRHERAGRWFM